MKLIIAGSRDITDYDMLLEAVNRSHLELSKVTEIVSGGARGADYLGEKFSRDIDVKLQVFPAKWNQYGRSAGVIRNKDMAEYADALIALWDGKSKGTNHMINAAKKEGLYIFVLSLEDYKRTK